MVALTPDGFLPLHVHLVEVEASPSLVVRVAARLPVASPGLRGWRRRRPGRADLVLEERQELEADQIQRAHGHGGLAAVLRRRRFSGE